MQTKLIIVLAFFIAIFSLIQGDYQPPRKQLAGPPEEFSNFILPEPIVGALDQQSAYLHANIHQDPNRPNVYKAVFNLPVDSNEVMAFTFFSPLAHMLSLELTDSDGQQVDLSGHEHKGDFPLSDSGSFGVPEVTYLFNQPKKGDWTLTVTSNELTEDISNYRTPGNYPDCGVLIFNYSPLKAWAHLSTYETSLGKQIGLVAKITDQQDWIRGEEVPSTLKDVIVSADMDLFLPDGQNIDVPMHDDGLHYDGLANDGIYGAVVTATEVGPYLATAVLRGKTSEGYDFIRSTEHIINVVDDDLQLTDIAFAEGDGKRINLHLVVNSLTHLKHRAYTEVWGKDSKGNDVPIAWLSSMVNPHEYQNHPVVTLELDLQWVAKAKAQGPYLLKNAFLQDADFHVPVSKKDSIKVIEQTNVDALVERLLSANMDLSVITPEMRMGVRPTLNFTVSDPTLVLLHGYCSSTNPWEEAGGFTGNVKYFLNKDASVTNDKFALLVAEYMKSHQSFGGIGHSQGGLVLLHLHNYYWTGLESAKGERLIQSVGSPYKGCSGAGTAANLIKIFGFGCGENVDLTVDGSKLWLTGILPEMKKDVYYFTTTYKQGNLFGDYCNLAVNLVLKWPNDGTSELDNTVLTGGNNMGNKEKWCHTTGMSYSAQYYDATRNKDMNDKAAR